MGTNFYVKGKRGNDDPRYHIGKRSSAGLYCWDCGITLCSGGEQYVHSGDPRHPFLVHCPKCGNKATDRRSEPLSVSAAGRELGFNNEPPKRKTGIASCSSFTWARELGPYIKNIVDEYGREYTRAEFLALLEECPIQYRGSIGTYFS